MKTGLINPNYENPQIHFRLLVPRFGLNCSNHNSNLFILQIMKTFFIQLFIVAGIVTLICVFGGLIDRLPFISAIVFGVAAAGFVWHVSHKSSINGLLILLLISLSFASCSQSSYRGLTKSQKQYKFHSTHKPTTNIFFDRHRAQWDR